MPMAGSIKGSKGDKKVREENTRYQRPQKSNSIEIFIPLFNQAIVEMSTKLRGNKDNWQCQQSMQMGWYDSTGSLRRFFAPQHLEYCQDPFPAHT
jgi:hypothetical protein